MGLLKRYPNINGNMHDLTVINSTNYVVQASDYDISVQSSSLGACTITIPTIQEVIGRVICIADDDDSASVNNITIKNGIGITLYTIVSDGDVYNLIYNGTEWRKR